MNELVAFPQLDLPTHHLLSHLSNSDANLVSSSDRSSSKAIKELDFTSSISDACFSTSFLVSSSCDCSNDETVDWCLASRETRSSLIASIFADMIHRLRRGESIAWNINEIELLCLTFGLSAARRGPDCPPKTPHRLIVASYFERLRITSIICSKLHLTAIGFGWDHCPNIK